MRRCSAGLAGLWGDAIIAITAKTREGFPDQTNPQHRPRGKQDLCVSCSQPRLIFFSSVLLTFLLLSFSPSYFLSFSPSVSNGTLPLIIYIPYSIIKTNLSFSIIILPNCNKMFEYLRPASGITIFHHFLDRYNITAGDYIYSQPILRRVFPMSEPRKRAVGFTTPRWADTPA